MTINGGTVSAAGTGTVELIGATVNAPVTNSSTGTISVTGSPSTVGALTNPAGGQVTIAGGTGFTLTGATSNGGTITMGGGEASLTIGASNVTLSGSGTLTLGGNGYNYIAGAAGADTLNNQSTIQGSGNIGSGSMALVNSGTINANSPSTGPLTIQLSNGLSNSGTLEATGGGTLILEPSGSAANTNTGTIQATSGSTLEMIGGTLTNTGRTIQDSAGALTFERHGQRRYGEPNRRRYDHVEWMRLSMHR